MQLEKNLWIADGYYVDFDQQGQLRIIGPNNHLFCGLIDIPRHRIKIEQVISKSPATLIIKGFFEGSRLNFYYPAMDDIRTVREMAGHGRSFLEIRKNYFDRLVPHQVSDKKSGQTTFLTFKRSYGEKFYYETTWHFGGRVKVNKIIQPFRGFELETNGKNIPFTIVAETNEIHKYKFNQLYFQSYENYKYSAFGSHAGAVKKFLKRTEIEINHLIPWGKTSGDNFGTVFPRDWMESADIGVHDLSPEVRMHMYKASLKNVTDEGQGWHEDVVGEYKYEFELAGRDVFDRHMIDIEPHYIMGLQELPDEFLMDDWVRDRLQRVTKFVLDKARKNDRIIFQKLPLATQKPGHKYYTNGEWRDSDWAFKKVGEIIAPFDVNAVFYPKALEVLKEKQLKLDLRIPDIDKLIKKWSAVKEHYKFTNKDGRVAYGLTAYRKTEKDKKYHLMKVNHLDESYLYTYGKGTPAELKSFCDRLMSPKYFYTPSGPTLIARNNEFGYTNEEYHGLVIWTKQVAFTVLGLSKHLKISILENWPKPLQRQIKETLLKICEEMISAYDKMGSIPELHYDDNGEPKLMPVERVSSSKVQLWSGVGARRIFRKYYELKTEGRYKI